VIVWGYKSMSKKHLEFLGWYGLAAILTAYALVSFGLFQPRSFGYQFLNLTGALGIVADSYYHRALPAVVLNIIWAIIAFVAIFLLYA